MLDAFQKHQDSWTRVASVLENSKLPNTKYIALNILEEAIKTRWKILPREEV
jgi:exportin-1